MIRNLINKLTGKYFWYSVRVSFVVNEREVSYRNMQIGLPLKNISLNRRYMAKLALDKNEIYEDSRLHSCRVQIYPEAYLGYFKKGLK